MAITVKDIHEKEFSKQVRGYNVDEVDDFLDQIANQLEALLRENREFREKAAAAGQASAAQAMPAPQPPVAKPVAPAPVAPAASPSMPMLVDEPQYFKNLENTVRDTLINAQRIADETVSEARKKADTAVAGAQEQAAAIVSTAKVEAESIRVESDELHRAAEDYRARFMRLVEDQLHVLKADKTLFD